METLIKKKSGLIRIKNNKYSDKNLVYSYKKRKIQIESPIQVFRNLNKSGVWYSIRQNGLTVAHAKKICVRDCEFIVNEKVRERVLKNKRREFHAFIKGYYTTSGMGTDASKNDLPAIIRYNPYENKNFMCVNLTLKSFPVKGAWFVICDENGVRGSYLET